MSIQVPSVFFAYLLELAAQSWLSLYQLLSATGLIYVPLLFVLLPTLWNDGHAFKRSLSTLLSVVTLTLAYWFCVQPMVTPTITVRTDADVCVHVEEGTIAQPIEPQGVAGQLPAWWALILSLSSSVTEAAIETLNCEGDLRAQMTRVLYPEAPLPDGVDDVENELGPDGNGHWDIYSEIARFKHECHAVAYNQWLRSQPAEADALLEEFGRGDVQLMGSRTLRALYYPDLRAADGVPGFPYQAERDDGWIDPASEWGRPLCEEWLEDPEIGIEVIVFDLIGQDRVEELIQTITDGDARSEQRARDVIFQEFINQPPTPATPTTGELYGEAGGSSGYWNNAKSILGAVGLGMQTVKQSTVLHVIRIAGPLTAALIVALIVAVAPFALVMSGFNGKLILGASLVLFSLMLYGYFYQLAGMLEHRLAAHLYPDSWQFLGLVGSAFQDPDYASRGMIVNFLTGAVHVLCVALLFLMLSWGGRRLFGLSELISGKMGEMGQMGGTGGQAAMDAATTVATRAKSAWKGE